jgi:hypothetical protein
VIVSLSCRPFPPFNNKGKDLAGIEQILHWYSISSANLETPWFVLNIASDFSLIHGCKVTILFWKLYQLPMENTRTWRKYKIAKNQRVMENSTQQPMEKKWLLSCHGVRYNVTVTKFPDLLNKKTGVPDDPYDPFFFFRWGSRGSSGTPEFWISIVTRAKIFGRTKVTDFIMRIVCFIPPLGIFNTPILISNTPIVFEDKCLLLRR